MSNATENTGSWTDSIIARIGNLLSPYEEGKANETLEPKSWGPNENRVKSLFASQINRHDLSDDDQDSTSLSTKSSAKHTRTSSKTESFNSLSKGAGAPGAYPQLVERQNSVSMSSTAKGARKASASMQRGLPRRLIYPNDDDEYDDIQNPSPSSYQQANNVLPSNASNTNTSSNGNSDKAGSIKTVSRVSSFSHMGAGAPQSQNGHKRSNSLLRRITNKIVSPNRGRSGSDTFSIHSTEGVSSSPSNCLNNGSRSNDDISLCQFTLKRPDWANQKIYKPQVKSRGKKKTQRDFDNLFLAQELDVQVNTDGAQTIKPEPGVSPERPHFHEALQKPVMWLLETSPDGRYLVGAGLSNFIHVWEVRTLAKTLSAQSGKTAPRSATKTGTPLAESSAQPISYEIYNPVAKLLSGHEKDITSISFGADNFFITGSMDGTARLWHPAKNTCFGIFKHGDACTAVRFNPANNTQFISASLDNYVRLWSIAERRVLQRARLPDVVTACDFIRRGAGVQSDVILAGTATGFVYGLSADTLQIVTRFQMRHPSRLPSEAEMIRTVWEYAKKLGVTRAAPPPAVYDAEPTTTRFNDNIKLDADEQNALDHFCADDGDSCKDPRFRQYLFSIYGKLVPASIDSGKSRKITALKQFTAHKGRSWVFISSNYSQITQLLKSPFTVCAIYSAHSNRKGSIQCSLSSRGSFLMSASEDKRVYIWDTQYDFDFLDQPNASSTSPPNSLDCACGTRGRSPSIRRSSKSITPKVQDDCEYFELPTRPLDAIFAPNELRQWFRTEDDPFLGSDRVPLSDAQDAVIIVSDNTSGKIHVYRNSNLESYK